MKNFKRILSLLLAVVMTLGTAVIAGAADVSFTDVSGHWAWTGGQIPYLVSKNVLNGYKQADGTYTFNPDGQVTRAEFIKMLDETFGLTETAPVPYADVAESDWYAPYIAKAAAQGYLLNYGYTINPNAKLTREEAISLLVRYLNLSPDRQELPSYFADYASISENFRDYIMEAVYEGMTDGYTEGGVRKFQPQRVLTRAEALTILFRAAGAVYNGTTSTRDYGAAGSNNTFVTAGSTVISNLNFEGRNIVSEGADGGTLTFMNCKFIGPLTIRGGADVIFYNCTANEVTVQGGGIFSLLDRSRVTVLRAEKAESVNVNSGTTVSELTVASSSLNIKGDGAVGNVTVQANGLVSTIVPVTYEVAPGLTAVFGGNVATGSSGDLDSFLAAPFVFSDNGNACLAVKPVSTGTVYAYYTNEEILPSSSLFDAYYEAATYAFRFSATGNVWSTGSGHTMGSVGGFRYMVVQLQQDTRRYRPILVPCEYANNSGFAADPVMKNSTLTVRASQGGTVWWYCTDSAAKLTTVDFLNNYDNVNASLKGTGTVRANTDFSIALKDNTINDYGYVALLLKNGANGYYVPLVVSVGDTGFSEGPEVKTAGTIRYKARESGTLLYYFTDSDQAPTADQFLAEYNAATNRYSATIRVAVESEFKFETALVNKYPYLVLAIRTQTGKYLQPVLLNIEVDTGFDTDPAIRSEGEIRFYTRDAGVVKYYYTTSSSAPTSEEFNNVYGKMDNMYRDAMRVSANSAGVIRYYVQYTTSRPYMVIMFTDSDGKDYSPILVELFGKTGTGFKTEPYSSGKEIVFTTEKDGMVMLFYTTSPNAMAADDFYPEYKDSKWRASVSVKGGVPSSITIDSDAKKINRYAVLAFLPDGVELNSRNFYYPFILDLQGTPEEVTDTALSVSVYPEDNRVIVTPDFTGTLYYYFTDYETDLPLVTSFDSNYKTVPGSTSVNVTAGRMKSFDSDGKRYGVFCLTVKDNKETKTYAPYIADLGTGREFSNGIDDDANMKTTGFEYARVNTDQVAVFQTKVSGTVKLLMVRDGQVEPTYMSVRAEAGKEGTIALPSLEVLALLYQGGTYYLQLTSDSGDVYRAYQLFTIN